MERDVCPATSPPLHKYIFEECLNRTESVSLWRGRERGSDRVVALKVINKHSIQKLGEIISLLTEIRVLRKVKHPNLIQMLDVVETSKTVCIILEWGEMDLHTYISNNGHLEETTVKQIAADILGSLNALHRHQILHRDIKPENIILFPVKNNPSRKYIFKLADLGLASINWHDSLQMAASGTPGYSAPEVSLSSVPETEKADIWSLGKTLEVALTGKIPKGNLGEREVLALDSDRIVSKNLKGIKVSKDCKKVLKEMLACSLKNRISVNEAIKSKWLKDFEVINKNINEEVFIPKEKKSNSFPKAFCPINIPTKNRITSGIKYINSHDSTIDSEKRTKCEKYKAEQFCKELNEYNFCYFTNYQYSKRPPSISIPLNEVSLHNITTVPYEILEKTLELTFDKICIKRDFEFIIFENEKKKKKYLENSTDKETKNNPDIVINIFSLSHCPKILYPVIKPESKSTSKQFFKHVQGKLRETMDILDERWEDIIS